MGLHPIFLKSKRSLKMLVSTVRGKNLLFEIVDNTKIGGLACVASGKCFLVVVVVVVVSLCFFLLVWFSFVLFSLFLRVARFLAHESLGKVQQISQPHITPKTGPHSKTDT